MTKTILAAVAALGAFSVPSFASTTHYNGNVVYQQDDTDYPADLDEQNPMRPSEDAEESD